MTLQAHLLTCYKPPVMLEKVILDGDDSMAKANMTGRRKSAARRGGGGKLTRSETVTVRLDAKLRYLAELAARKQRRTLSSFIEWAIDDTLKRLTLGSPDGGETSLTLEQEASRLWDINTAERFARLAVCHPELLTYDEQVVWKLLNDSFLLSPAYHPGTGWNWEALETQVFPVLREYWPDVMIAALGSRSEQREWVERRKSEVASGKIYPEIHARSSTSAVPSAS